jgi:hypothetical protein
MADAAQPETKTSNTFKEAYVPLESRESQRINWKPFAYEFIKLLVITKVAALAGYFSGKHMAARNIKIGKIQLDGQSGYFIGGIAGFVYELFHHWKKTEGKRLGVANISGDLKTSMDPAQLEREATKEAAFVADLKKLSELQSAPKSFTADIAEKREVQAATAERGA